MSLWTGNADLVAEKTSSAPQQSAGLLKRDRGTDRSSALAIRLFTARFYLWVFRVTFFLLSPMLLLWLQVKMSYQVPASFPIVPSDCRFSYWKTAADCPQNITSTCSNWSTSVQPVLDRVHFRMAGDGLVGQLMPQHKHNMSHKQAMSPLHWQHEQHRATRH